MLKKYMKCILLIFGIIYIISIDNVYAIESEKIKISESKSKACYYGISTESVTVYKNGDTVYAKHSDNLHLTDGHSFGGGGGRHEVDNSSSSSNTQSGQLTLDNIDSSIYSIDSRPLNNDEQKAFLNNGNFKCIPLYAYQISPGNKIVITFTKNENPIESEPLIGTVNGQMIDYVTTCKYKAYGITYKVKWNPSNDELKTSYSKSDGAKLKKITNKAKKNYDKDIKGLMCDSKNIVFDKCGTENNFSVLIRTMDDDMCANALSTTYSRYEKVEMLDISNICNEDTNVVTVMRLIGYALIIFKILIPIGLIIFGSINFTKAFISGNQDNISKTAMGLVWQFIAAVVIFVLPTIVNFVIGLIDNATDGVEDYENCRVCILEPKKCVIPK